MQNIFWGMHKTHAIFMHSPCTPLDGAVMHSSRGVQNTWRYATWILLVSINCIFNILSYRRIYWSACATVTCLLGAIRGDHVYNHERSKRMLQLLVNFKNPLGLCDLACQINNTYLQHGLRSCCNV